MRRLALVSRTLAPHYDEEFYADVFRLSRDNTLKEQKTVFSKQLR